MTPSGSCGCQRLSNSMCIFYVTVMFKWLLNDTSLSCIQFYDFWLICAIVARVIFDDHFHVMKRRNWMVTRLLTFAQQTLLTWLHVVFYVHK